MSSVGSSIDQDIIRLSLQPAFDHGLQILIFNLKFFKGQIVHIDNKFVIPVLDLGDHIIQILKLMLVYLDHPQSLIIVLVQDRFDGRRFAGAGVPVQQTVVRFLSFHKSLCIFHQFLLCIFISHKIRQVHVGDFRDRNDCCPVLCMLYPERLVKPQFSHAEFPVELGGLFLKLFRRLCLRQSSGKIADPVPDPAVKYLAVPADPPVVPDHRQKSRPQRFLHIPEIILEEFLKDLEIMKRRLVDASVYVPHDLTGGTVPVFMTGQQIGQIILPEVSLKPVAYGKFQDPVHRIGKKGKDIFPVVIIIPVLFHQKDHIFQDLPVLHISV